MEQEGMVSALFDAYLEIMAALHDEIKKSIAGLPAQALDWVPGPEMNSLAVLIVHTAGSERFWIGDVGMREPSGRDREAEFVMKGLSEKELVDRLDGSLAYAREALARLLESELGDQRFPQGRAEVTVAWGLLHALEHLGIHVGHIQMVRQLWDKRS
jgi:hypothetical protein